MHKNKFSWRFFQLFLVIAIIFIVWKLYSYQTNIELFEEHQISNGKISPVLVTVYYEALCPDSKSFIIKQLLPAYEKAPNLMDVELVPYGKAITKINGNHYEFECQHSYVECEANKIHSCVIYHIPKTLERIRYVACMIKNNNDPMEAGSRCADELSIDFKPINECANSVKGSELLKEHGDRTQSLQPKANFIPTVVLNNNQQLSHLAALLKNLLGEVCNQFQSYKPHQCL